METLIDVIVTGDTWTELAETIKAHLTGETEEEQIAEAMRIVAERGYTVIRDEEGGHNTVTSDASGRRAIAITVEPSYPGGKCIMVEYDEATGQYQMIPSATPEDWADVRANAEVVEKLDDLTGWGEYTESYRVDDAVYFVASEE